MTPPPPSRPALSFRCAGCRRVLGLGWPDRLEVGPAAFRKHVTIECLACGAKNRWYPSGPASPTTGVTTSAPGGPPRAQKDPD